MNFFLHIIITILHWLPTVLGYNLVFGKGKIFHFGPLGVAGASGYALFVTLKSTGSLPLSILVGCSVAILASLLFTWLSLRLEPDALGVMTIAVHLMVLAIVLNWTSVTRGALGIPGIPRPAILSSLEMFTVVLLVLTSVFVCVYYKLYRSSFGRQLSALAEHNWHARSLGINRAWVHAVAFCVLGLSHVYGAYFGFTYIYFISPNDFQFPIFIFLVMAVIAGNPGSFRGSIISATLIVALRECLRFLPLEASVLGPVRLILFGLILFGAVWIRRDTLFSHQRSI